MEIVIKAAHSPDQKAVKPVRKSDKDKSQEEESLNFRFVAPGVIDVDFEEVRSFPVQYTITTYNERGDIVVLECAPRSMSIKA